MMLQGHSDVSNILIENGQDDESLKPLISAILKNEVVSMEQLVIAGLDVNSDIMGVSGLTILTVAILSSAPDVKLCLEYGADPTRRYRGLSMYEEALHKDSEIVKMFFPHHPVDGFSPASVPCHPPCLTNQFKYLNAIMENNEFAMVAALRKGAEPRAFLTDVPFPIFGPVTNQNLTMLTILLESGVRPNVCNGKGLTPLHVAAKIGSLPCCRMLLLHGAAFDMESPDGNPLQVANGEEVAILLKGVTLLFHMARHGDLKYVKNTLKQMTDEEFFVSVNCLNRNGRSLMQEAFRYGYPEVAQAVMGLRIGHEVSQVSL